MLINENVAIKYPGAINITRVKTAHGMPIPIKIRSGGRASIINAKPFRHQSSDAVFY